MEDWCDPILCSIMESIRQADRRKWICVTQVNGIFLAKIDFHFDKIVEASRHSSEWKIAWKTRSNTIDCVNFYRTPFFCSHPISHCLFLRRCSRLFSWNCIPDFLLFTECISNNGVSLLLILLIPFCEWIAFKINILPMMNWTNWTNERRFASRCSTLCFLSFRMHGEVFEDFGLRLQCVEWNVCLLHLKHAFCITFFVDRLGRVSTYGLRSTTMHIDVMCK